MRWGSVRPGLVSVLMLCLFVAGACSDKSSGDVASVDPLTLIIVGGTVFSGADQEPVVTDIGVRGDTIVAIGDLAALESELRIDATGLAVTPGFIDIHSHAVRENKERSGLFLWPAAENQIRQGVTTVIGGPDGGSPLPISATLAALEENPATINYGTFVGQGSIRAAVVGEDDRPPTADELQGMRDQVAKAMQQGAFGLSSGLVYAPGSFATTEEVIELARVAAQYGGIYISHMRQESSDILKSVAETIRIGEEAGLPTQITHHKVIGASMWGKTVDTLAMVDAAVARGVDVSIDQYPYTASSTGLSVLFPQWALDGDRATRLNRMQDPVERKRLNEAIQYNLIEDRGGNDPARVVLAECTWNPGLNGLNLTQVLQQQERAVTIESAAELVIELQVAGGCAAVYHAISEDDVLRVMSHPRTMIASDGGIYVPGVGVPHPRNYGSFARVLGHYVRDLQHLPLHTAIYKMTQLPADRIGLADRGRLTVGAIADIAIFDPATITDRATFENPHQYAEGVHYVFVAGQAVLLDSEMLNVRPGRVLRSQSAVVDSKATQQD